MSKSPEIFHTLIQVPPGPPWVQQRAAKVAAELEAPLAPETLDIAIARLEPWRPKAPARLAIGFLRASDEALERRASVTIENQVVEFVFRSRAWRTGRQRRLVLSLVLAIVVAASLVLAIAKWVSIRDLAAADLDARALAARRSIAEAKQQQMIARHLTLMDQAGLGGRSGAQVAQDLAWLGGQRQSGEVFEAVIWRQGALEVEGDLSAMAGAERLGPGRWRVAPPKMVAPTAPMPAGRWRPSMRRGQPR